MWMWYHAALKDTVLFKGWDIRDAGTMVWACVLVIICGILLEFLRYVRWAMRQKSIHRISITTKYGITDIPERAQCDIVGEHLAQTILYFVQVLWSYILMNIYMTFSMWLCLALCLGLAIGNLLFASKMTN